MSDDRSYGATVQFLVPGWGTDEDFERRVELERILDHLNKLATGDAVVLDEDRAGAEDLAAGRYGRRI